MLRKIALAALVAAAWLPAQTNIDLTTGAMAPLVDGFRNGLASPIQGLLGSGYARAVPFTAAAGNFMPIKYGKLIPIIDIYATAPLLIGFGQMDASQLTKIKESPLGASIYTLLSPFQQYLFAPVPVLSASLAARIDLPILKAFEITGKFGLIPKELHTMMEAGMASLNLPVGLDLDASVIGVGVRWRVINTTLLQLSVSGHYDTLNSRMNISLKLPELPIYDDATKGKLVVTNAKLNIYNQYTSSVASLNAQVSINLAILQIYGGVGLNMDLSKPYISSNVISGDAVFTAPAGLPIPATVVGLNVTTPSSYPPVAVAIPKFSVGARIFYLIDVQAESTFDFKSLAARVGLAIAL